VTNPPLQTWTMAFQEAHRLLGQFMASPEQLQKCADFSKLLKETLERGGNTFSCGNGGSHCDAMHFAEELTGRYRKERKPLGALALGDPSHLSCVANDYGFEHVFSRQLAGLGRKGDLLVGLSTSGNSPNVCLALETAKKIGMKTVALLGRDGGKMKTLADLSIVVPASTSDRIQEMHIKIIHIAIEACEREMFPENY
jgi:D-sedoheptulose 7-phosphate isomerase